MRKIIVLLNIILICTIVIFPITGKTQNEIVHYSVIITLNPYETWVNKEKTPEYGSFLFNGRLLLSSSFFKENLPFQITEENSSTKMTLTLSHQDTEILFFLNNTSVIVNEIEKEIDCFPFYGHDGTWLLPVRFIFETLEGDVGWNAEIREITVEIDL